MKTQVTEWEKIFEIFKTILFQDLCAKNRCAYEYEKTWIRMFVTVLLIITKKLERSQIFVTETSSFYLMRSQPSQEDAEVCSKETGYSPSSQARRQTSDPHPLKEGEQLGYLWDKEAGCSEA